MERIPGKVFRWLKCGYKGAAMRSITPDLKTHLAGEVTSLATCWKLTRTDATVMGFTDHDADLEVGGVAYKASTGFTPTAVRASASLDVDDLDVEGMLDSTAITEEDVMAGLYDFAEIEVFQVSYAAPDEGSVVLRRGWLGEISLRGGHFVSEVRGLSQKLSQQVGYAYSPACRATLGDSKCKVTMASHTESGTISSVTSRSIFADSSREESSGYFAAGKITFTSGANAGISMEVKEYNAGGFVLMLPMPYVVETGDGYSVQAGCDKTFGTCVGRFDNAINFRGEPHVPGLDRMLETSTTRSEW